MLDARSAGWQCAGYRGPVSDKGREFSRRDVAGWLEGPKASLEDQGFEFGYKGQRLGLPESGPGSVAGFGRRFVALAIDWLACVLIANLVSSGQPEAFLPLVIFFVEVSVLTALMGSSFGQRILGIRVVSLSTGRLDPARSGSADAAAVPGRAAAGVRPGSARPARQGGQFGGRSHGSHADVSRH